MGGSSSPQPAAAPESGPKVTMLSAGEASSRNPRKKKRGFSGDTQGGSLGDGTIRGWRSLASSGLLGGG